MSMRFVRVPLAPTLLALTAIVACSGGQASAQATGDPAKGKAAFIQHGCWQCHDFNGQGSVATSNGKVIARTQLPIDAFISFVRTTSGEMPPFRAPIISDEELTNIYAYLQSLPAPKPVTDIPLLNDDVRSQ
jgi:mono/diheme cytochrome c family protein